MDLETGEILDKRTRSVALLVGDVRTQGRSQEAVSGGLFGSGHARYQNSVFGLLPTGTRR
jgi:hypothetical protein